MLNFFRITKWWWVFVFTTQAICFAGPFFLSYRTGGLGHALTVLAMFSTPLTLLCVVPAWILYRSETE